MKELNKLRLLAGICIDPSIEITEKKEQITEARHTPLRRADLSPKDVKTMEKRVARIKVAVKHITAGIKALEQIPATDFMGDIPHFINELDGVVDGDGSQGGLNDLVAAFEKEHRQIKRKETARVKAEEEEELAMAMMDADEDVMEGKQDTSHMFTKGDKVMYDGHLRVVEVPDAKDDFVGVVHVGNEGNQDAVDLVKAAKLRKATEEECEMVAAPVTEAMVDDKKLNQIAHDVITGKVKIDDAAKDLKVSKGTLQGEINLIKDTISSGNYEKVYGKKPPKIAESMSFYVDVNPLSHEDNKKHPVNVVGQKGKGDADVWDEDRDKMDKDESPTQMRSLDTPSDQDQSGGGDLDKKVKVPASCMTALKSEMAEAEKEAERLDVHNKEDAYFYKDLARMFKDLIGHLEKGTIYDIKQAQIFMTSLMGPMLHKIPAEVVKFISYGGQPRSLATIMKDVSKDFPIVGPRNSLK